MAQIVSAFAVTHAVIMIRTWERAPQAQRDIVRAGYDEVARRLRASRPDALLMVGGDHFQSFFLDNMPAFCLGVGEQSIGWGDGGLEKFDLRVDGETATLLLDGLLDRGFDIAFSRNLPLDHAFMSPVQMIMPEDPIPIVPLFQNCNAPPLPAIQRCLDLGAAIRAALESAPSDLRVSIIGTGGLSHRVPLQDWRTLGGTGSDKLWLEFMSQGRHQADPDLQRRIADEVVRWGREGLGRISEDFDAEILALLERGDYGKLANYRPDEITERGGNGAQEIRNWATVAGAMAGGTAETLFYQPVQEWLTGVAGVAFNPGGG